MHPDVQILILTFSNRIGIHHMLRGEDEQKEDTAAIADEENYPYAKYVWFAVDGRHLPHSPRRPPAPEPSFFCPTPLPP
jgi:hypothetical protein